MSFRPTISIYFRNQIVEVGYYHNWGGRRLLRAALTIASALSECKDVAEIRRIYHENSNMKDEKPLPPSPREELEAFELCSECAIVVDLTARCIYINPKPPGCLPVSELAAMPAADLKRTLSHPYFLKKLDLDDEPEYYITGPIWFDQLDLDWVRKKLDDIIKRQAELWAKKYSISGCLKDDDLNNEGSSLEEEDFDDDFDDDF